MKKNRFIQFAMLAASVGMLASCGETPTSSKEDSSVPPTTETGVSVPTEEGKVTFYFTMKSTTPEIPSYVSPFLTGCMAEDGAGNWYTKPGQAVELKKMEGKAIYYGFATYDPNTYAGKQNYQYQLTLGYNSTAEVGDNAKGIDWGKKSDVCAGFAGLLNPTFKVGTDGNVDLGEHGWEASGIPNKPVILKNYTLQFNLDKALPAGKVAYLAGNWNTWATTDLPGMKCTVSADRMTITKGVGEVLCSGYEYVLLYEDEAATELSWSHKSDSCYLANGTYSPVSSNGDNYTHEIADGFNDDLAFDVTINLVVSDLVEGNVPCYKGAFSDGWKELHAFEKNGENWKYVISGVRPYSAGKYEFGIAHCTVETTGEGEDQKTTYTQLEEGGWMGDGDGANLKLIIGTTATTITVTGSFAAGGVIA